MSMMQDLEAMCRSLCSDSEPHSQPSNSTGGFSPSSEYNGRIPLGDDPVPDGTLKDSNFPVERFISTSKIPLK